MLFSGLCIHGRIFLQQIINGIFQKFVGTETFRSSRILHHEIRKAINMTTGLQHNLWGKIGALHFQHIFRQNEMFSPQIHHCSLEATGRRTQVKKTLDSAMDFERWNNEHLANDQIIERLSVELRFACSQFLRKFPSRDFQCLKRRNGFLDDIGIGSVFLQLSNGRSLASDLRVESVELVLNLGLVFYWCFRHCFREKLVNLAQIG
mmetsp:Transcript_15428/g.35564  ORF Transcript_15428/g.35564 Transcript_15428/m.35564 type:complete len:206 (+) Transcript_15428:557-1174(+)